MDGALSAATLDDLRRFLTLGLSILAVTRDAKMVPNVTRSGGARLGEDGALRVLVAMPEGEQSLANLGENGLIALTCVLPSTYRTLQVKGRDARRIEWPEQEAIAAAHRPAFSAEVVPLGLPPTIGACLWSDEFVTIAFTPLEVFDQTPGPMAGLPAT